MNIFCYLTVIIQSYCTIYHIKYYLWKVSKAALYGQTQRAVMFSFAGGMLSFWFPLPSRISVYHGLDSVVPHWQEYNSGGNTDYKNVEFIILMQVGWCWFHNRTAKQNKKLDLIIWPKEELHSLKVVHNKVKRRWEASQQPMLLYKAFRLLYPSIIQIPPP